MSEIEPYRGSVGYGVILGVLLTICWLFLAKVTTNLFAITPGLVLAAGELLLLMVAAWYKYKAAGETETAKGIVIAAAIVFLLSASCWAGVVLYHA